MQILEMEQGTDEWLRARMGIPTASQFKRIVTPGGRLSTERHKYMGEMIVERVRGVPMENFENEYTERGKLLEADARRLYEMYTDYKVERVGFIRRKVSPYGDAGCSPDGIIGGPTGGIVGLLEIKCVNESDHLLSITQDAVPAKYWPQIQGSMWVTGAEWIDFVSYHPDWPPLIKRVEPDNTYQNGLTRFVPTFVEQISDGMKRLRSEGYIWEIPVEEGGEGAKSEN